MADEFNGKEREYVRDLLREFPLQVLGDLRKMIRMHDRLLIGGVNEETGDYVPGALQMLRDARSDIGEVKDTVTTVVATAKNLSDRADGNWKWILGTFLTLLVGVAAVITDLVLRLKP